MEFSTVQLPQDHPGGGIDCHCGGRGRNIGMFSLTNQVAHGTTHLSYAILRDDWGSTNQ
ncbi:hypothetical protein ACP4OV_018905 [Aristida adscensionis]